MTARTAFPLMPLALLTALVPAALLSRPSPANAADGEPMQRYQIEKTKYGFVRLDRTTGGMTFCREDDDALTCDPIAGTRPEIEADIGRMAKDIEALKARLDQSDTARKALEKDLGDTRARLAKALETIDAANRSAASSHGFPSEAEIDSSFQFMERMMKRFLDMTRELDENEALPEKT